MRLFGFDITRQKRTSIPSFEEAIIDLQERVNALEHHRKVKVQEAVVEEATQTEIEKVLSSGDGKASVPSLWEGL